MRKGQSLILALSRVRHRRDDSYLRFASNQAIAFDQASWADSGR